MSGESGLTVTRETTEDAVSALSSVMTRGFDSAVEASRAVLELIHELVGMRVCVVTRVDVDADTLTVVEALDRAGLGITPGMVIPLHALPCDYVARSATPVRQYDLKSHPVFAALSAAAELGLRSYVGVPLKRSDGSVWGTLAATDSALQETTDGQLKTLTILARLLSLEFERDEQRAALARHAEALADRLAMAEALDQERLRAMRLQGIVEAAGAVSHEINNPLTVVQLRLGRIMKRVSEEDAEMLDDLESAIEAADEIQKVTVQLRSVVQPVSTRYLRGKTRIMDLAASTTPPAVPERRA